MCLPSTAVLLYILVYYTKVVFSTFVCQRFQLALINGRRVNLRQNVPPECLSLKSNSNKVPGRIDEVPGIRGCYELRRWRYEVPGRDSLQGRGRPAWIWNQVDNMINDLLGVLINWPIRVLGSLLFLFPRFPLLSWLCTAVYFLFFIFSLLWKLKALSCPPDPQPSYNRNYSGVYAHNPAISKHCRQRHSYLPTLPCEASAVSRLPPATEQLHRRASLSASHIPVPDTLGSHKVCSFLERHSTAVNRRGVSAWLPSFQIRPRFLRCFFVVAKSELHSQLARSLALSKLRRRRGSVILTHLTKSGQRPTVPYPYDGGPAIVLRLGGTCRDCLLLPVRYNCHDATIYLVCITSHAYVHASNAKRAEKARWMMERSASVTLILLL